MSVLGSPAYTRGLKIVSQVAQANNLTEAGTVELPADAVIQQIIVENNTTNIVLGGLKFGTTAGATDVLAALAVGASALVASLPLKYIFSRTLPQTIYIDAVTGWNGADVNVLILYGRLSQ